MKKRTVKFIAILLSVACAAVFSMVAHFDKTYPSVIHTATNEKIQIDRFCTAESGQIRLFGIIPVKSVNVSVAQPNEVLICGTPFGVMLYSRGVMVVGSNSFKSVSGEVNPSASAGIKSGDILITLGGEYVTSNEDVARIISSCSGKSIPAVYERDGVEHSTTLHPQKCLNDGVYKIGLWVRDSSAGIGTMTFYDIENGVSVGFGHGICDADTGQLVENSHGTAVSANLYGIKKGAAGNPGELLGTLNVFGSIGKVSLNDTTGVYIRSGYVPEGIKLPVASWQEVKTGDAKIYLSVDGKSPQYYSVKIDNINPSGKIKNFTVTVTDKDLINRTGGIVQGMSGTPIIQNGLFIGAITHVFINDSTTGYGIFAENMLETAQSVSEKQLKEVS